MIGAHWRRTQKEFNANYALVALRITGSRESAACVARLRILR